MRFCDRIRLRREELGLSQDELAKRLGYKSRSTINKIELGINDVSQSKIIALSKALETTIGFLMGDDELINEHRCNVEPKVTEDYTTFPVIGDIAAGFDHIVTEDWTGETIDVPNSYLKGHKSTDFFVLCVKGNSMFPTYQENDKVLILRQTTVNYSGQVGAVIYDDEYATLKRVEYRQGEDWMKLVPINPTYPTVVIEDERLEHCRVLGIPQFLLREINER